MANNFGRVAFEDLRTVAFGSINASFTLVGTTFAFPVRQIKVTNGTDANILIRYSALGNAKDVALAKSIFIYDYSSNRENNSDIFEQSVGEGVYIEYETGAPTVGSVYVTVIYARG